MSPSCSFRSFGLCFIALFVSVDRNVNAFAIRPVYSTTHEPVQDLAVEESLQLEVKHDFNRPNDINGDVSDKNNDLPTTVINKSVKNIDLFSSPFAQVATTVGFNTEVRTKTNKNYNFIPQLIPVNNTDIRTNENATILDAVSSSSHEGSIEILTEAVFPQSLTTPDNNILRQNNPNLTSIQTTDMDSSMTVLVDNIKAKPIEISASDSTSTAFHDESTTIDTTLTDQHIRDTYLTPHKEVSTSSTTTSNYNDLNNLPPWKRYTVIERKRVATTDETPITTERYEEMDKAETRVTLNSFTPDVIPLEKVTKGFLDSTKAMSGLESLPHNAYYQEIPVARQTEAIIKSNEVPIQKPRLESVTSKRAGFLNLSTNLKQKATTTNEVYATDTTSYSQYKTPLDTIDTNKKEANNRRLVAGSLGSQSYLDEDAIKEELLQEISLKNNEEIAEQNREERFNMTNTTSTIVTQHGFDTTTLTSDLEGTSETDVNSSDVTNTDSTSNIKPIQDKSKSTAMYAVNPNYKPMKKIDIQPPKPFVRDPDDNSWRNESISSLGIVFKPKNSSKPFTQVLKNKTETEWSSILSKDSKSDTPDLRERLERIAQKRKTKKKNGDLFGNIIYTDYEESNSSEEITNTEITDSISTTASTLEVTDITTQPGELVTELSGPATPQIIWTITTTDTTTESNKNTMPMLPTTESAVPNNNLNLTEEKIHRKVKYEPSIIEKGKKHYNIFDYYDTSDDDESEYLELAKLELKKYSIPLQMSVTPYITTPHLPYELTKPLTQYLPERKGTIQYFPPRSTPAQPKPNRFDNDFERKIKANKKKTSPKEETFASITNSADTPLGKYPSRYPGELDNWNNHHQSLPVEVPTMYKSNDFPKNLYHTEPSMNPNHQNTYGVTAHNEAFNRASYVIKNYKDFIEQAAKDYDYERDFIPYTQAPLRGLTISDLITQEQDKVKSNPNFNYDYDSKFRKDVLQRFVDNFNHNDERYDSHFPVLYNNTVMHVNVGSNAEAIASSRAFLKGLYNPSDAKLGYARREPYDPNCDNVTVELSPAYELHYYVPEQEEKEEVEPRLVSPAHP